ncbi:mitochondrial fission ELM1 family protein [Pelagibacteraceae bacterium]|nr:mitochondrial fission ELM1 family protein [Pelagibacteraceae bacterium]
MLKLKAHLLTQGMHGMISQVEGLSKALNINFSHHTVKLKPFWNLVPPKFTPISENLLTEKLICNSKIIISCGRKSVIHSIALKKRFKKDIFNIHIQDPKVSLENFDLIICPEHDNLRGDNVITTVGAIHYLTKNEIDKNAKYIKIDKENKKLVSFILGGPNKYYDYSEQQIDIIFNKVKTLFTPDKYKLIIIPSYRTPKKIIQKAYNTFSHNHLVFKNVDKNAYLSSLSISDFIVITCDSTSMISESAVTGKPIYVANMPPIRNNNRFKNFYTQFKKLDIIRDLEDNINIWNYNQLDEVNRIAPIIKERMKSNGII